MAVASVPLTREEYFQKSLEVGEATATANGAFCDLPFKGIPRKRCARRVRRIADRSERAIPIAAAVEPPAEIAELHARLLRTAEALVRKVRRIGERALAGDLRCAGVSSKVYRAYSEATSTRSRRG